MSEDFSEDDEAVSTAEEEWSELEYSTEEVSTDEDLKEILKNLAGSDEESIGDSEDSDNGGGGGSDSDNDDSDGGESPPIKIIPRRRPPIVEQPVGRSRAQRPSLKEPEEEEPEETPVARPQGRTRPPIRPSAKKEEEEEAPPVPLPLQKDGWEDERV